MSTFNLDHERGARLGFPEVIYGPSKPTPVLLDILHECHAASGNALYYALFGAPRHGPGRCHQERRFPRSTIVERLPIGAHPTYSVVPPRATAQPRGQQQVASARSAKRRATPQERCCETNAGGSYSGGNSRRISAVPKGLLMGTV
jgi:hypothetical protein